MDTGPRPWEQAGHVPRTVVTFTAHVGRLLSAHSIAASDLKGGRNASGTVAGQTFWLFMMALHLLKLAEKRFGPAMTHRGNASKTPNVGGFAMRRWFALIGTLLASAVCLLPGAPSSASDLSISIGIGTPPPAPPVIMAAPPLVVVPGSPVYYAPEVPVNIFFYGGRYYTFHDEAWFRATTHNGPWNVIAVKKVPRPVLTVPVEYYNVPPDHWKQGGPPPWAGHGKGHKSKHKKSKDD